MIYENVNNTTIPHNHVTKILKFIKLIFSTLNVTVTPHNDEQHDEMP